MKKLKACIHINSCTKQDTECNNNCPEFEHFEDWFECPRRTTPYDSDDDGKGALIGSNYSGHPGCD